MAALPSGTITFLFTDIEGSTRLLRQLGGDRYAGLLADQRDILRTVFEKYEGQEVDTQGDSFFVGFPRATQAVSAAVEIQSAIAGHAWPDGVSVEVRMGLHTGEPLVAAEGYIGIDVHRAARIAHIGHGGQVLLSETTTSLVRGELPPAVTLHDLGGYRLKDIDRPETIHQLVIDGLRAAFPALKASQVSTPARAEARADFPMPGFLSADADKQPAASPIFVAREKEMERLQGNLAMANTGQGQIIFVVGGPGRGKTALMEAFGRRAQKNIPDLLLARGQCNAYTGEGDPYQPFRQILNTLTGDVEGHWASGSVTTDHARRLWAALPQVVQSLVDHGEGLLDVLVPAQALLNRARAAAPRSALALRIEQILERAKSTTADLDQKAFFAQVEHFLRAVAREHPLLLVLDDLQWADTASIHLFFHLGREIAGTRLMILGAYRPEQVAAGRAGRRHPLEEPLNELKRHHGDSWIDLREEKPEVGRMFVEAYVASEPNQLSNNFREALFRHTQGHPLFTIEMLRNLQERGDLIRDDQAGWLEGPRLDWQVLPARVEGVIAERIGRLEEELREVLTIASVEGGDFTAQVVAQVRQAEERGVIYQLSRELDRRHRLVGERGSLRLGQRRLHLYRFRHGMFQQHIYNGLTENERQLLHEDVGTILEGLYEGQTQAIAPQLAWHFSAADVPGKAAPYLLQAGDGARAQYAFGEAQDYYERAVPKFKALGDLEQATSALRRLAVMYQYNHKFELARDALDESYTLHQQFLRSYSIPIAPASHPFRFFQYEPTGLDPGRTSDLFSSFFIKQLFSGLFQYTGERDIAPDIAISWEVFDGGRKYIFSLREDVFWSDGEPVIAEDFELAWKRLFHPDNKDYADPVFTKSIKGALAYQSRETEDSNKIGVQALGPTTLEVELEEPSGLLFYLLSMGRSFPVPKHRVGDDQDLWAEPNRIVTNGPFCIGSWQRGKAATLVRNERYYGNTSGNVRVVEIHFSPPGLDVEEGEIFAREVYKKYQNDEIDYMFVTNFLERARREYPGELFAIPADILRFLNFSQPSRAPFDDSRVRKALAHAIDREHYANVLSPGGGFDPGTGGLIPPAIPGHTRDIGLSYDPELARSLLAEAGYPDGANFPDVLLVAWPPWDLAEFVCGSWERNLNVKVRLEKKFAWLGFSEWSRQAHFAMFGVKNAFPDPIDTLQEFPDIDHLLNQAQSLTNPDERIALYRKADRHLVQEAMAIPLVYPRWHWLIKPWIKIPFTGGDIHIKDVIIEPR
jgi:ABC-type oligopeptide transport system substrate-binding subunit/class 3 adenylate cyclase